MRDVSDIFDFKFEKCDEQIIKYELGKILYSSSLIKLFESIKPLNKIYFKIANKINLPLKCVGIYEPKEHWNIPNSFKSEINSLRIDGNTDYYIHGYWEDISYIEKNRDFLKKVFIFKKSTKNYDNIAEDIMRTNSVAIHIRRGDYLVKSKYDYNMCPNDYYKKAISYIKENVENPYFYFFSDDNNYVKKEFSNLKNAKIVEGNKDYEDLQLMSLCKNIICANSTFSFWAAFLSNRKGLVCAPKLHYIYDNKYKKEFLYLPEWKIIDSMEF